MDNDDNKNVTSKYLKSKNVVTFQTNEKQGRKEGLRA
jgi:hypothetical protein